MQTLNEAYVLGALPDVEHRISELTKCLHKQDIQHVHAEQQLDILAKELTAGKKTMKDTQSVVAKSLIELQEKNVQLSNVFQEIAGLKRRSEELKKELIRLGKDEGYRKIRRERAKLLVQTEEKEHQAQSLESEVQALRDSRKKEETAIRLAQDQMNQLGMEMDQLQAELPDPKLLGELADSLMARAHCQMFLDRNASHWQTALRTAIDHIAALHRALKKGRYRLDKHSDLVAGRSNATSNACYGALCLDNPSLAKEIFELASDPQVFFHHIFQVFRLWCVGLYVSSRKSELEELLKMHWHAPGLRGGYVRAFAGLLTQHQDMFDKGVSTIVRQEWDQEQATHNMRGLCVINVNAIALLKMGRMQKLSTKKIQDPTIPKELCP